MRGKSVPSPERDSIQTLVATKRAGEWRLAAFQNTRVRPIGRNAAGTFCVDTFGLAMEGVSPKEVSVLSISPLLSKGRMSLFAAG